MNPQDDLDQQEEYENRVFYFNTKFDIGVIPSDIRYKFMCFKGTQKEFDELYNEHVKGKEIELGATTPERFDNEWDIFPSKKPITSEQAQRNRVLYFDIKQKDKVQRNEANRYLSSGYR